MAWVAFDRAIRTRRGVGRDGPVERWRAIRDEIHAEVCANGLRRRAAVVRAVVRLDAARREPAADPAGRLPARRRTSASSGRSRRSGASWSGTGCRCATRPTRRTCRSTACRRARASSCPARSGTRPPRAARPAGGGARRSSSGCSGCATTSACSRRSTTRRRVGCSATSRRRSRIWRSSPARTCSSAADTAQEGGPLALSGGRSGARAGAPPAPRRGRRPRARAGRASRARGRAMLQVAADVLERAAGEEQRLAADERRGAARRPAAGRSG